jgi:uncharacterized protein (TIGR02217 family)
MSYTADTIPVFPVTPNYGFVATPTYKVAVVGQEAGFENVNRVWARPLLFISAAPFDDCPIEEMEEVMTFFHAMGGPSTYFRFTDYSDYKSCGVNEEPTKDDQPLVEIGSSGTYQLVKDYTSSGVTQRRDIYKPVGSTILVANASGVLQDGSKWNLNEATGVLTPNGTFTGVPTTWGGEFAVEVRFTNTGLSVEVATYGTRNTRLSMRERRRAATT